MGHYLLKGSIVIGAMVGGFLLFNQALCGCSTTRSKVSRARSDMRSMATALENYKADFKVYPASTTDVSQTPMSDLAKKHPSGVWNLPMITSAITTPVAYVTSLFPDPDAPEKGRTFQYHVHLSGEGWIMWGAGPDGVYQLDWRVYDPGVAQPSIELLTGEGRNGAFTYDPTNATVSAGDIWRVKQ